MPHGPSIAPDSSTAVGECLAVAASVGAGDFCGKEAGPVEVEEGAEMVVEEGVDLGAEGVGDEDVAEPLADDAAPRRSAVLLSPIAPRSIGPSSRLAARHLAALGARGALSTDC